MRNGGTKVVDDEADFSVRLRVFRYPCLTILFPHKGGAGSLRKSFRFRELSSPVDGRCAFSSGSLF